MNDEQGEIEGETWKTILSRRYFERSDDVGMIAEELARLPMERSEELLLMGHFVGVASRFQSLALVMANRLKVTLEEEQDGNDSTADR